MKYFLITFTTTCFILGISPTEIIPRIKLQTKSVKNFIINHHDSIDNELLDFYSEYSKKLREGILVLTNHKIQRISMPIENDHSNRRELITEALQWVGTPYKYGGNSRNGIDCSAYVQRLFRTQGVLLPRTARGQYKASRDYAVTRPLPGDVVYFRKNKRNRSIVHCGIVLPMGKFIHASGARKKVVVSSLWDSFYRNKIAGYRRFIQ